MQRYSSLNSSIALNGANLGEEGDCRVQTPAGDEQQREAGAGLFVVDADVASFVERHGFSSSLMSLVSAAVSGGNAFTKLQDLSIECPGVSELPTPKSWPCLRSLELRTSAGSLAPLGELRQLDRLVISGARASVGNWLSGMNALRELELLGPFVAVDIPFGMLPNLVSVVLSSVGEAAFVDLAKATKVRSARLSGIRWTDYQYPTPLDDRNHFMFDDVMDRPYGFPRSTWMDDPWPDATPRLPGWRYGSRYRHDPVRVSRQTDFAMTLLPSSVEDVDLSSFGTVNFSNVKSLQNLNRLAVKAVSKIVRPEGILELTALKRFEVDETIAKTVPADLFDKLKDRGVAVDRCPALADEERSARG